MNGKNDYSPLQMTVLVILRFLIGWHLLYEGFSKLLIPNWSSFGFLHESKWILEDLAHWILAHENVLSVVDFLNTWGLIAIGLGLILGLFTQIAAVSGALLLFIYYLNNPPLVGLEYTVPTEGTYLIVSKTLIESFALVVLVIFPTGNLFGLDMLWNKWRNKQDKEV